MQLHDVQQRTPEWFALRCGRITGTNFTTMANGTKPGIEKLCLEVATQRITGKADENGFTNGAMEHGISTEDRARSAYEIDRLEHIKQVGFISLDEYIGISPDGLVGEVGGVEIKCPMAKTHFGYWLKKGTAWKAYRWQVQGFLFVTKREWIDFVSFCPDFEPEKRLLIERVFPDPESLEKLSNGMERCIKQINELTEQFNGETKTA